MVSEEDKNLFIQAQNLQQQMQGLLMQKEALGMQAMEIRHALEELEKSTENEVYKITGTIIIRAQKDAVRKELEDRKAGIEAMSKTVDAGEKKLRAKITEMRSRFGPEKAGD